MHITHTRRTWRKQALALVGQDVYEKLVEWLYPQSSGGRECKDLPSFIIKETSSSLYL